MKYCVVIPGYNEEKYLTDVLKKVQKVTDDFIYVDDGSTDRSLTIARRLAPIVLIHEVNLGKGAAMRTGAEYAFSHLEADAVIFLDSDDQHDPTEIPKFLAAFGSGAELVFGVRRFGPSMPASRLLGNRIASVLVNMLFQRYIPDIPSGYKGLTKRAYRKIRWHSSGYEVETEIAARTAKNKLPFTTVLINQIYHDREKGMNVLDALRIALCLIQWKFEL